ncbi:hypothetical protein BGZ49_001113 [Haplosporangium sp. Z 27]|nr:hypothetical protein BGZ49_001113 [Haplosporangium sp. Z 27]
MLSVLNPSPSLCLTTPASFNKKKSPQPYGVIPPRKKSKSPTAHPRTLSSPTKPVVLSHHHHRRESFLHSFQSLLLSSSSSSDSTSSSYSFWSTIKAQLPPWTTSLPSYNSNINNDITVKHFAPPTALLVSNSSPIVTLDSTPLVASSSTEDPLLSLPNIDPCSSNNALVSGLYPVSVAAVDKLKMVMRTDIISLKTFNHHETLVEEDKCPSSNSISTTPHVKRTIPKPPSHVLQSSCRKDQLTAPEEKKQEQEQEFPLPRNLASRETRSNSDYLRMMASEMRMIRAHKLICPLKPRGYLPRRKDIFRNVKSSLCVSIEIPCEMDGTDSVMVGSWTSVSSTDTFLSAASSDYMTADEESLE